MGKGRKQVNDEEKRSLMLSLDMKVMRALAGNDENIRKKFLKNLRKWLEQRSQKMPLIDEDLMRIWKSLYYTMWMSDKPLVQEQCAEGISKLVHFSNWKDSLRFFKFGLLVLSIEWFGIDQWRFDKFMMFVRRLLRQALIVIKKYGWKIEVVKEFNNILLETVLKRDNSGHLSLTLHFNEIFLEELAKVSLGKIQESIVHEFLKPFIKFVSVSGDNRQINHTCKVVFHYLLSQTDEGIEYEKKFEAWRQVGFPGGHIDAMQRLEKDLPDDDNNDDDDEEEVEDLEELDPRAGKINVELPQLKFNPLQVVKLLKDVKFAEGSNPKTRKTVNKLITEFQKLRKGEFPLGIKEIPIVKDDGYNTKIKQSVNRLVKFEKKLLSDSNKNRKRKRKHPIDEDNNLEGECELESEECSDEAELIEQNKLVVTSPIVKDVLRKVKRSKCELRKEETEESEDEYTESEDFFAKQLQKFIKKNDPVLHNRNTEYRIAKKKNSIKKLRNKIRKPISLADAWNVEECDESFLNSSTEGTTGGLDVSAIVASPGGPVNILQNILLINGVKNERLPSKSPSASEEAIPNGFFRPSQVFDDWHPPLKDGEYEYFTPSPKYQDQTKKMVKKLGQSPSAFLNNAVQKLSKNRHSLDSNIKANPFAKKMISPERKRRQSLGVKKVKINLNLNQSQDLHEHDLQVRQSPGIPFDANKKPLKPLLKPFSFSGPTNPFYKYRSNGL